jgi:IS5 family transposase
MSIFNALLLAVWYDLSDVKLAEALDDRTSFRPFCGSAAEEPTPERTAFGGVNGQPATCERSKV